MKYWLKCLVIGIGLFSYSQEQQQSNTYIDVNFFGGNIILHNPDILHLIKNRPEGFIVSYNQKTYGDSTWQQRFNYPDYGLSFSYQDFNNETLGKNFALYAHYNFYVLKRNVMFRVGQGLAYATNPYHKIENPKNIAFGSSVLSATYFMLNYKKTNLFKNLGLQTGLTFSHYSNANVKAPNTSVNTIALNVGITYDLKTETKTYISNLEAEPFKTALKYNIAFRSGINQSDVIGSGQFPFYILSLYADKRLSHTSALQFGSDVFFSNFLKELIYYQSVAFPENNVNGSEDFKRVGVFVGHELFINKMSFETQLGYYVYYPYDFEGRTYFRIGLKRYFGKTLFGAVTLKSHGAKAEAVEFGIGVRL